MKSNTHHETASLQNEIQTWLGVPYKYGGNDKNGIDCSGLVCQLFKKVYQKSLPRTAKAQHEYCKKIHLHQIKEGDLIFFNFDEKGISHVGIYCGNGKFVHASVTKGVVYADIANPFFQKKMVGIGRFLP
jgi:cell wall-associated NlpC family hydrolase